MSKHTPRYMRLREEDYWLFPTLLFTVLFGAVAVYASVLRFRLPAIISFAVGAWFISFKMRSSYSNKHAHVYVGTVVGLSLLLALFIHGLTN